MADDEMRNPEWISGILARVRPDKLRCGVEKRTVTPGRGPAVTRPFASVMMQYALFGWDYTQEYKEDLRLRKNSRGARRSEDESPPVALRLLDSQGAVSVTVGITSLLPGLDIGLGAMREGEVAVLVVPAGLGFRSAITQRIPSAVVQRNLVIAVHVKTTTAVEQLPCGVLRSFSSLGADGPSPGIDDVVTISVQQPHPTTQAKGNRTTTQVTIGSSPDSPYDDVLLSARKSSIMTCHVGAQEHSVIVVKVEQSSPPHLRVLVPKSSLRVSFADVSPYEWSDPAAPLDLFAADQHVSSPATPDTRFSEFMRWKSIGRQCMETQKYAKACRVYRRSAAILLAEPSMLSDTSREANVRKELSIVLNNLGRAFMMAGSLIHALDAVDGAIRCNGGNAKAYFLRAQVNRQLGHFDAALTDLDWCGQCPESGQPEIEAERERVLADQAAAVASPSGEASDAGMGSATATSL